MLADFIAVSLSLNQNGLFLLLSGVSSQLKRSGILAERAMEKPSEIHLKYNAENIIIKNNHAFNL